MLRLYLDLKFDRPVGPNLFPSVGGFEVVLNTNRTIGFDFMQTEYTMDDNDPSITHVTCLYPDTESFPDMDTLEANLHNIVKLTECYIDTEAYGIDEAPNLEQILSFVLESSNMTEDHENTPFVTLTRYSADTVQASLHDICWVALDLR